MKFDELEAKLRVFETAHDLCVMPEIFMVARIDGRNFTRLTKDVHKFDAPFDVKFRDYMIATVEHLMDCGFRVIYGYTQSDEISLLLHRDEGSFGRKLRKLEQTLMLIFVHTATHTASDNTHPLASKAQNDSLLLLVSLFASP
jgi:tRNA(His) guanylyltransferase